MIINSSAISMNSTSLSMQKMVRKETLTLNGQGNGRQLSTPKKVDLNDLMKEQMRQLKKDFQEQLKNASKDSINLSLNSIEGTELQLSDQDYQKIRLLELILSKMTGKEVKFIIPEKVNKGNMNTDVAKVFTRGGQQLQNRPQRLEDMVIREREVSYEEHQEMSFNATGSVQTADGKSIDFTVDMKLAQSFSYYEKTRTTLSGKPVDPLVINLDGTGPSLTNEKISFDLNADGKSDQISFLTKGSGFLVLDSNQDGKVNNGTELFGPQSGDGFTELAKFDLDGNNWIDENDKVFDKLQIWTKDETGKDQLLALGEVGVGAIYLGHISSAFDFKSSPTQTQGQLRENGIYLKEDGKAGVVSHIDLTL